jgi:hypothetical protein
MSSGRVEARCPTWTDEASGQEDGTIPSHLALLQRQELERAAARLASLTPEEWSAVESLVQRLGDQLFSRLRRRAHLAARINPELVRAARFFFDR